MTQDAGTPLFRLIDRLQDRKDKEESDDEGPEGVPLEDARDRSHANDVRAVSWPGRTR